MTTPVFAPMEAKLVAGLPEEAGWQFEPKWDGFRALVFRDGDDIEILSKSGKSLARYFPEIVALVAGIGQTRFVLDGELILPVGDILSFDALQARLHPAQSRITKLSRETPAQLMLFDCLADPYRPGERAMLKVKQHRTADCVIGGIRRAKTGDGVASLLLGLYDDAGRLNHVGFTSGIATAERAALAARLEPLIGGPGFTGKAPGGPSRWNNGEENEWVPLRSELVVEVLYDQVTGARFRHGTRLLRWRPDKAPAQCTMEQLVYELRPAELATITDEPHL
jgi:ATP-dependent DNA ligase